MQQPHSVGLVHRSLKSNKNIMKNIMKKVMKTVNNTYNFPDEKVAIKVDTFPEI